MTSIRRPVLVLAAGALTLATTGCGSTAPAPAPRTAVRVAIAGFAYAPATLTVSRGSKITWVNHDATAHTATTDAPGFDTGTIGPGASASVTVTRAGIYRYVCSFHPFMRGTIVVR